MNTSQQFKCVAALALSLVAAPLFAQTPTTTATAASRVAAPVVPAGVAPPADYVIGVDDALEVVFWRDKDMSATVSVRPDGKISLPLLNDVQAAGLTPEQLRLSVTETAGKLVEEPVVSIVVKTINSRKVFITGQVGKPGPYLLMDATTVLQLIAMAGGVNEYAAADKIRIVRVENGKTIAHSFNYKEITEGKRLTQNIALKPGDTVIVP